MKVLFIPDFRKGNAYQKLLSDSLQNVGVDVVFSQVFFVFSLVRSARRYWKPDLIHMIWTHPFFISDSSFKTFIRLVLFILDVVIVKLLGIKIVWTVHNKWNHEQQHVHLDLLNSRVLAKIVNLMKVESQNAKSEIQKLYRVFNPSKIVIIPEGNYIDIYRNTISPKISRQLLGLNLDDLIFLYFGQIRPYKGVAELVEVFRKLHVPQAKLLIVGKPNSNEIAEDILSRCIGNENIKTVFKFIPDNEVQIYMNAADVVVLPYRDILTSGAVMLAVSFGKPVIAPAIGCIPDVLDDEGSFLYNPSDDEGLLKAMQCAFDADLERMGKHNFKLAEKISWDDIGKCTYDAYKECLTRR